MSIHNGVWAIAGAIAIAACSSAMTVGAVSPHPNVVIPSSSTTYALELAPEVPDAKVIDTLTITQFRTTLENGFKNATGTKYSAKPGSGSVKLVLDSASLELSNLGTIGRFLTIRFRARWVGPDGSAIAELAGTAQPRNPTETGPRHVEDVVEVMYEMAVDGLNQAAKEHAPAPANAKAPGTTL